MKKLSKAILIVLAALVVVTLALVFGLNLYVQSPRTQARIQEELSRALRLPLKITNTSITPWSDLRISGISIPSGGANFLEASSFTAKYRLWPLLHGKLEIPEMVIESPKILWVQNADGDWKLPKPEDAPAGADSDNSGKTKVDVGAEGAARPRDGLRIEIGAFKIKDGTVELLDAKNQKVWTFSGVDLQYTSPSEEVLEGMLSVRRASWAGRVYFDDVRSPFHYTGDELTLPELTGTLAGGPARGDFRGTFGSPKSPFKAGLSFERADLARISTEAGSPPGQASGKLDGLIEIHGNLRRMEKVEGTGSLHLRDGQLRQLELFQTIGEALRIRELSDFRLKDGTARFHLADERVNIDEMLLDALALQLSATGTVRFDGRLDLNARLGVEEGLANRLTPFVRDSLTAAVGGRRSIDFTIKGTTEKPKPDLLDRLIGQKIGTQFNDLLSDFFGTKKEDEKKKEEEQRKKEEKKKKKAEKKAREAESAATGAPATPSQPVEQ